MIEVYSWDTPNGHKIHIMLEECGISYKVRPVDISAGQQFHPTFLEISPNNKIPAIVDPEGAGGKKIKVFESGAILIYLAEKTARFLPVDPYGRYAALQWVMWQMSGMGPTLGQMSHFFNSAPDKIPYAIDRFSRETKRLYGVLDRQLQRYQFVACNDYTISDIAIFPWVRLYKRHQIDLAEFQSVKRWFDAISNRPAVQRGLLALSA